MNSKPNLNNLKIIKPGEIRNPWGRGGKNGNGGFSLKTHLKNMLAKMDTKERDSFFIGLLSKAAGGDVSAMKLILEMNDEANQIISTDDDGLRISIQIPPKDKESESKE